MFIKQFVSHAMNFNLESSVFRESTNFFFGWYTSGPKILIWTRYFKKIKILSMIDVLFENII
jgi:hypothetical protein